MCAPGVSQPGPANAAEALAAVRAGLSFLATADAAGLTTAELAEALHGLAAFGDADGAAADGHGTSRSWLRWQTRITDAAAAATAAWTRRLGSHPQVAAALAAGQISASWARHICDWTEPLPGAEVQQEAAPRHRPPRPALPVPRLLPAAGPLSGAPPDPPVRRRPDEPDQLPAAVRLPSPDAIHRWGWREPDPL